MRKNVNANCCSAEPEPLTPAKRVIKDFYDTVAVGSGPYPASTDRFSPAAPTEKILEYVKRTNCRRILDVGCGMGTTLLRMAQEHVSGVQFIGVDFSEKMIERARTSSLSLHDDLRKKIGFFVANAESLPYMEGQFDFVFSECVLNLIPEREKAIAEVMRVLAPGGMFVYTDFVAFSPISNSIRDNLNLVSGCRAGSKTLSENIRLLEETGFVKIECIDFTSDKNKRYADLMNESEQIRREFEEFRNLYPDAAAFLDERVGYYLILGCKPI
ncbi:putative arsinothricin biosynthesis methyltransferase ArsM [Alicyclobacillus acidocaldarius]|uniref:Methyltransferase type 11 n=1 Tax=Alicyclobacillus acidocaldarius subsp. acidocaldarius (strain ATCC 27009 / DSM 446 / BCRC 14685 / JCM 5260 / KCTC 1825 / NBRC 15652 / NCIMB 11725 / NRRL B-14509 / 104-IA) TaxID=521098 RepID=C8WY98_ALIAD|nr:putative arsinothricin biosynthesis methyltransferase ArsM [Alicyclobacillus acidocaldarius]ACV59992.1 Methyltransferase type 11 [Alicyclobacillus acidocaldarius subsp. acidocaldarius DSM 446]